MPNGLRHGFAVAAFRASVPPHLGQRWLGHASLQTTATHAEVSGAEEFGFAESMWGPADTGGLSNSDIMSRDVESNDLLVPPQRTDRTAIGCSHKTAIGAALPTPLVGIHESTDVLGSEI